MNPGKRGSGARSLMIMACRVYDEMWSTKHDMTAASKNGVNPIKLNHRLTRKGRVHQLWLFHEASGSSGRKVPALRTPRSVHDSRLLFFARCHKGCQPNI